MRKRKTEKMVVTALLASFSYILLLIEVPIFPGAFPWLKLDFSDIPILIGTFIIGPVGGITVAFIRSTLNFALHSPDILGLIGNLTGFIASVIFIIPIYFMNKKESNNKNLLIGTTVSSTALTVFMSIANYFVITPMYITLLGFDFGMPISEMVLLGIIPFNIIKGILVSIVFVITFKKLVPILEKKFSYV